MTLPATATEAFLDGEPEVVEVRLTRVRGSSPREAGTAMLVAATAVHGTIGGGQLEYMAIDAARQLLARGQAERTMDVPLGPDIGQCCGGRVELRLRRMDEAARRAAIRRAEDDRAALPHVYVLGAGHVGRALAACLALLPVRAVLVDGRPDELARCAAPVEARLAAIPEAEVRAAPAGSAFVVLTHDHALDFLLTAEALGRGDAAYVGMIGSATKRARFAAFCRAECDGLAPDALVCPIGALGSDDKRPEVIAAFVAAEVIAALTRTPDGAGRAAVPAAAVTPD